MKSRLFNTVCLALCVLALMVAYQNWSIGSGLESQLVECIGDG